MTGFLFRIQTPQRVAARLCAAFLATALLVALWPTVATAADVVPTLRSEISGDTAVRNSYRVFIGGTAPSGTISRARLVGLDANGVEITSQEIESLNAVGVQGVTTNEFIRNDGGQLSGQATLDCKFGEPAGDLLDRCQPATAVRRVAVEVTVAGASAPGLSAPLRVDYTRPVIEQYELVKPDRIRVVFSEPVRQRQIGDLASDWTVAGATVVGIEGAATNDCTYAADEDASAGPTGCTRTLLLSEALGEDTIPNVDYTNSNNTVPTRTAYQDFGSNRAFTVGETPASIDLVRPAAPTIVTVGGTAPAAGRVIGATETFPLQLSNAIAGHTIELTATSGSDVATSSVVVPDGATPSDTFDASLTVPRDGQYLITAVAVDPSDNRSDQTAKSGPGRADGASSVTYVLDRVAPTIDSVNRVNSTTIDVVFSEPIRPAGDAGQWTIGDELATAEGSGDSRSIVAQNPTDGDLSWSAADAEAYSDEAGNALAAISGRPVATLPGVSAPKLTSPTSGGYTRADLVRLTGTTTFPAGTFQPAVVAELFDKGGETVRETGTLTKTSSTTARWSIDADLPADGRYEFQVRLSNPATGIRSARINVPDIVRDTTVPVVEVTSPAAAAVTGTGGPQEYNVGDVVPIKWTATDAATNDPKRPDHGKSAKVYMVGKATPLATGLPYAAGQEQTFNYKLTSADLLGKGMRDLSFKVVVDDLAGNTAQDVSSVIRLLGPRVTYTAMTTAPRVISVRFSQVLKGTMFPTDWTVDGQIVAAEQPQVTDGRTTIKLNVPLISDPNARPMVDFAPSAPRDQRLRSSNDSQLSLSAHRALDRIRPALTVKVPDTAAVVDRATVTFTGTTDTSASANTIRAYRADAAGNRVGSAIKSVKSAADGKWTLAAPLVKNTRNRIVIRATDPSTNNSATLPGDPYSVVEDSKAPVVSRLRPARGSVVGPSTVIRWTTTEANKRSVALRYRPAGGSLKTIAGATSDDGAYRWSVPSTLKGKTFTLRVVSTDTTGKTGTISAADLRLDAVAPQLRKARAIGPKTVKVVFSEAVVGLSAGAFDVDGIDVRRVKGSGDTRTLVLRRSLGRTTPTVSVASSRATDRVGNALPRRDVRATRGFAFPVTDFDADRLSTRRVRLTWTDVRNRASHLRGYRVYRDGDRVATLGWAARSYTDRSAKGAHTYKIRALDDAGRTSAARRERVR